MTPIAALAAVLDEREKPALVEIAGALRRAEPGATRVAAHERLRPHVYRLTLEHEGGARRSLILKRMRPEQGARERLLARRFLPAAGVGDLGPPLLTHAAERNGERVWHVHCDLGDVALAHGPQGPDRLGSAVDAITRLHLAFRGRMELGFWRRRFGDLGLRYLQAGVVSARGALEAIPTARCRSAARRRLRNDLLERLAVLSAEAAGRVAGIRECGGIETLVHGDLHGRNVLLPRGPGGYSARIIDWDHAAIGYGLFDLATFLEELAPELRWHVARRYRDAMGGPAWASPSRDDWNGIFDSARRSRITDEVVWDSIAVLDGEVDYGFGKLAMWLETMDALQPLLPEER